MTPSAATANAADERVLEVVHETRYDYAAPVSLAHHLAHLQPLDDERQRLLSFDVEVEPEPVFRRRRVDAAGNASLHFGLALPHLRLAVRSTSRVRLRARGTALQPSRSPAWESVARSLRYVARAPFRPEVEFTLPSPHVPRLSALRDYAGASLSPGRPVAEAAIELMHRVHADHEYVGGSTAVDTPLAQVVAQRRGVCQDFAHLMAGALRVCGLPARYVSGYLLTRSPDDDAPMIGADASHAWVQVWCPGTPGLSEDGWLDLDPTNDVVPDTGHVRVAVGRDYADVTPLRGVIRGGGGSHTLSVAVRTRVVETGPRVAKVDPQEGR